MLKWDAIQVWNGFGLIPNGKYLLGEMTHMNSILPKQKLVADLDIPLERDVFLRTLIRELAVTLEDVVGLEQAAGFISTVGQNVGDQIDQSYKTALNISCLSREQVTDVLVDLKRRIKGDFYVIEQTDERIVLGSRSCPFGEKVKDRMSMCMMTSNVFGIIAAENLGYAKVELQQTIAQGHPECRVVVYLKSDPQAEASNGREYFRSMKKV